MRSIGGREHGFSVIEAMIALGVAASIIVVISGALASGLRGALNTKVLQQATALGDEAVEQARAFPFDALALRASGDHHGDTDGDGRLDSFCVEGDTSCADGVADLAQDPDVEGDLTFDPDGSEGSLAPEPLALSDTGALYPHVTREQVGETTYTLWHYVTWVDANTQGGIQRDHKRIVAVVTWPIGDKVLSYRASSFVSDVTRGVAVTKFDLDPLQAETTATAGASDPQQVWFTHVIANKDVPEVFDLVVDGLPLGWTLVGFYDDSGPSSDGWFDAADGDALLTDTDGSGHPDTAELGIDQYMTFYVVVEVPAGQSAGDVELTLRVIPRLAADATEAMAKDTVKVQ